MLASLCALSSVSAGAAETIYKQKMPDGSVIYTDTPIPKASTQKTISPDTSSYGASTWSAQQPGMKPGLVGRPSEGSWTGPAGVTIQVVTLPKAANKEAGQLEKAQASPTTKVTPPTQSVQKVVVPLGTAKERAEEIEREKATGYERARAELEAAVAAREQGRNALTGERTAKMGGGSRLNEKYFARQQALTESVDKARGKLQGN